MSAVVAHAQNIVATLIRLLGSALFLTSPATTQYTPPAKMQHIVIVGGSFAGISTAHRVLKQAAALEAKAKKSASSPSPVAPFKVTLVSRDSHFFWNIAAPRGVVPGEIPVEDMFRPIAPGFKQYGSGRFEFVLASAEALDADAKTLKVRLAGEGAVERVIPYDHLVLATGSRTAAPGPFKSSGSTESTIAAVNDYRRRIETAGSIVLVGAGPTGVETAGELAWTYKGAKKVILVSAHPPTPSHRPVYQPD
jgi:NADH dehydrogenase FAD-containing subunit